MRIYELLEGTPDQILFSKENNELEEAAGVGTIQPHNTTVDVKPGEIQRQAKKWGWKLNKHGVPPTFGEKKK